jgi:hypothetical protein
MLGGSRLKTKSVAPNKRAFNALVCGQLSYSRKQAFGVGWRAQKIRGFFERFELLKRAHDTRLLAVAHDDVRLVIVADAIQDACQVSADGRAVDGMHDFVCRPVCTDFCR